MGSCFFKHREMESHTTTHSMGYSRGTPRRSVKNTSFSGYSRRRAPTRNAFSARSLATRKAFPAPGTVNARNRRVSGLLGLEVKYHDTFIDAAIPIQLATANVAPATFDSITTVPMGDGPNQRDGRKYVVTSVHVKGTVSLEPFAGVVPTSDSNTIPDGHTVMIAMVQDTRTNGAKFSAVDVFNEPPGSGIQNTNLFRNLEHSSRFKVLATKRITFTNRQFAINGTGCYSAGMKASFEFYKTMKMPVIMESAGSTVSTCTDNNVSIVCIGDRLPLQLFGSVGNIKCSARTRFVG
jgi:hypothetical protein